MDLDLHDQTLGLLSLEAKESQKSEVHTIRYALSGRQAGVSIVQSKNCRADTCGANPGDGKAILSRRFRNVSIGRAAKGFPRIGIDAPLRMGTHVDGLKFAGGTYH